MGAIERVREVRAGKKNIGGTERVVRGSVGPALIVVGVADIAGFIAIVNGGVSLVVAVIVVLAGLRMTQTAITQRCYVNAILGRDTCRVPEPRHEPAAEADV